MTPKQKKGISNETQSKIVSHEMQQIGPFIPSPGLKCQSTAQVEQMSAAGEQAHEKLKSLRSQLASKTTELAAAERRADHAETAIERIADVIRTQLPAKLSIPPE